MKCLQEEAHIPPEEAHLLPRVNARGDPVDDLEKRQQEELEEHVEARDKAIKAEETHIVFLLSKNRARESYKLFLVPSHQRRLFTHHRHFEPADRLQTFIELTATCPDLPKFREGLAIHIKHTTSTNIINIVAVGHVAGSLNLENEVQIEDITVDARKYLTKKFIRKIHEYLTNSQGPGVRRGDYGKFTNKNTNLEDLNEDDALAISSALALYGQNFFSALSAINAIVIDIQLRNTELGQETIQRLQILARKLIQTLACVTINNDSFIDKRLHDFLEAILRFGRFTTTNTGILPTIEAIDADELKQGIAPGAPTSDPTLKVLVESSTQIAKLVKRVTTKDLKQYGCITPANIDGVGLVVQGCLETIVNATYYPYCAKFRDELVAPAPAPSPVSDPAPSPVSDYELNAKGEIVVLGCAIKIEDEYDQGNNKKRKTSS